MKSKQISSAIFSTVFKRFFNTKPQNEGSFQWIQPIGVKTGVEIYNPLTKCKSPLIMKNDFITWYTCGPTLYDSAHIGHASTYVRFDIIRRILNDILNIDVIQIMGLTDIDDKIINRANKSKQDWRHLTKFYENEFFEDMYKLNIKKPYHSCRVSDYIPQIIEFVNTIVDKKYAYVTKNGSVYFDTLKYQNYGKLHSPEPSTQSFNPEKKSPLDFALWKASKEGEPYWTSPWGNGRPGWHIECSAIASTIFGDNIDIHSGGIDLAFPHHENEEAQSCCFHGSNQWINYWLHTGHLFLTDNVKMSKSLKNTISIRSFLKDYTANEFRFLCLMTHYRYNVEFSEVIMINALSVLRKIECFLQTCNDYVSGKSYKGVIDEPTLMNVLNTTKSNVFNAIRDDFNTRKAIDEVIYLIKVTNKMLNENETKVSTRSTVAVAAVSNYVSTLFTKFGITRVESMQGSEQTVINIVDSYTKFRECIRNKALSQKEKDVELLNACDLSRKELSACGINVNDRNTSSTWSFVEKLN